MTEPRAGRLAGRLIGLGVTGSIAAYKAVELLRLLRAEGADVAVMLTPSAAQFVGPLSFAALSRHPVETELLGLLPDGRIGHIVVGDSADAIVVAPATAHFLGAMANGLAGDVVTATCLALDTKTVEVGGQRVHLTGKEYQMLELLSLRKGTTLTKEMFLNHLYGGMDEPELKIIDVFICKLRKKLANASSGKNYIETVWGRGHVLREPTDADERIPA